MYFDIVSYVFITCRRWASVYSKTCFKRSPAVYGHFSLSGYIFHVYFMANPSNAITSHILGNFMVTTLLMGAMYLFYFFLDCYLEVPSRISKVSFKWTKASFGYKLKVKMAAFLFAMKLLTLSPFILVFIWKYLETHMKTGCFGCHWVEKKV